MLCMSFVVAVPVSQLRASPRKGSKLLLQWMCVEVLTVAALGLMDTVLRIGTVVVSCQTSIEGLPVAFQVS